MPQQAVSSRMQGVAGGVLARFGTTRRPQDRSSRPPLGAAGVESNIKLPRA
jgi:hypothetical protein